MKENHKQQERSIKRWNDYVKRTSNYQHLINCKKQQDKSIESSRAKPQYRDQAKKVPATFHETLLKQLQTTVPICSQLVNPLFLID